MNSLRSYRELTVWQKSIDLTVKVYEMTRRFPAEERYGITSQMRRAASSVPANIAEGQARRTTGEVLQALGVARGSLAEPETFLILCERLGLMPNDNAKTLSKDCAEINRMLHALMRSLPTGHRPQSTSR